MATLGLSSHLSSSLLLAEAKDGPYLFMLGLGAPAKARTVVMIPEGPQEYQQGNGKYTGLQLFIWFTPHRATYMYFGMARD